MTLKAHAASVVVSAVSTPILLDVVNPPSTKEQMIGLLSAVVIQVAILGLTELRKYLSRRKKIEKENPAPSTTSTN